MVVGGGGNVVEIHDSCFSRWKCNCSRLHATTWIFVGVKRESGTPVLHLSLIAPLRHCSPSLGLVSYTAPQVSVTTGVRLSLQWWTRTPLRQSLCEFRGTWMLTNTIKPTWMHVKVNLRPYWENEFKCVINGFKGSVRWVWWCCRVNCRVVFITILLDHILHISF